VPVNYIGSHTVFYLQEKGEEVIVLDNLTKGHYSALLDTRYYEGDIHDNNLLEKVSTEYD